MEDNRTYEGFKIQKGSATKVVDPLTIEQPLEIAINGKPFTVVMQTPKDELNLTVGLLFAEDVLQKDTTAVFEKKTNDNKQLTHINVVVNERELGAGYLSARSLLSVSSCGICGKQSLDDLPQVKGALAPNSRQITLDQLFAMQQEMFDNQTLFSLTGGCHGVAAFDAEGNFLALKEDIGRHNALDKVIGQLILNKQLKKAHVIMFSGRVSYEIVSKCFRAKIPIIMAVSAPSSLAVDFAKEYEITLLSFARNGKATCYSAANRIKF